MHLLNIEELQDFLNEEFKDVEPELIEEFLLQSIDIDIEQIIFVKKELNIDKLPNDFTDLITHYNFSNLTIGIVQFGYNEDLSLQWLIDKNKPNQYGFEDWYNLLRENRLIRIGGADPFTILLNVDTGYIYATTVEIPLTKKIKIAESFTHFIEGLGSAFMAKRRKMQQEFLLLAESEFGKESILFWKSNL